MRSKIKPFIFPIGLIVFFIFNVETVILGMQKALSVCAFSIIPSLFVFTVLSDVTVSLMLNDASTNPSPKTVIFGLGALCGFPIGASICEKYCKSANLNVDFLNKILPFCNITSPAFVIGAIGVSMFQSKRIGIIIYFSQLAVALIPVLFIKTQSNTKHILHNKINFSQLFLSAVENSVFQILKVCALICLFSSFLAIFENSDLKFIAFFTEIGCGSSLCSIIFNQHPYFSVALCGFCCGFSGLCVHMQVFSVIKSFKPSYAYFIICKLILGIFTAFFSLAGYYLFF